MLRAVFTSPLASFRAIGTVFASSVFLLLAALPVRAQLEPQPAGEHSGLVTKDDGVISDEDFAKLMAGLLFKNGTNNVRDAKFLFQECFGGGMLDDLQSALSNAVRWVGGSASKHNERAFGESSSAENKRATLKTDPGYVADPPEGFWTRVLREELGDTNQTVLDAINHARDRDREGVNAPVPPYEPSEHLETGQSWATNGGDTITLTDTNALSHHAILWGGDADRMSIYDDIENMRETLTNAWGPVGSNVTIDTLFGDGMHNSEGQNLPAEWHAQPATLEHLTNVINSIRTNLNPNEQFLFFGHDHGTRWTNVVSSASSVPADHSAFFTVGLSDSDLGAIRGQVGTSPYVQITYLSLASGCQVVLNGVLLSALNPSSTSAVLVVPASLLGPFNTIAVDNSSPLPLTIFSLDFVFGQDGVLPGPSISLTLSAPRLIGTNTFVFEVGGEPGPGRTVEIQASHDLQFWFPRTNSPLLTPTLQFQDTPLADRLFYRAMSPQFMVVATAGNFGSVTPGYVTFVNPGDSVTLTATPQAAYDVDSWFVDGLIVQSGGTSFMLSNIQTNKGISVTFRPLP